MRLMTHLAHWCQWAQWAQELLVVGQIHNQSPADNQTEAETKTCLHLRRAARASEILSEREVKLNNRVH